MCYSIFSIPTIVASFAEAWIEIYITTEADFLINVASFAEAWIEITVELPTPENTCRLLRGGVD